GGGLGGAGDLGEQATVVEEAQGVDLEVDGVDVAGGGREVAHGGHAVHEGVDPRHAFEGSAGVVGVGLADVCVEGYEVARGELLVGGEQAGDVGRGAADELGAHPRRPGADRDRYLLNGYAGMQPFVVGDGRVEGFAHAGVQQPVADADDDAVVGRGGAVVRREDVPGGPGEGDGQDDGRNEIARVVHGVSGSASRSRRAVSARVSRGAAAMKAA